MVAISKVDVRQMCLTIATQFSNLNAVDYNSWQESEQGLRLASTLDKNVVLAEGLKIASSFSFDVILIFLIGYKEYNTGRKYLAKMGDWRKPKDEEVELDGIGGVNILVKADVHRSGQ